MKKVGERLHPKQFAAIESKLARVDMIDHARIAEIRREILDGCFQVNSEVVANRLLALAKEMLTGKNMASAKGSAAIGYSQSPKRSCRRAGTASAN